MGTYTAAAAPVATVAAAAPAVTYTAAAAAPVVAAAPVATVAATPVTYANAVAAPVAAPLTYAAAYAPGSQFHAQDEFGNLNYGYSNLHTAKHEVGNTYGGVSGAYSYVDADGVLQHVNYVAEARAAHLAAVEAAKADRKR